MDYAVEMEHITKSINGVVILNDVSMKVKRGEIFGFLGPNGAGKTTIMKVLFKMLIPDSGSSKVLGRDINEGVEVYRSVGAIIENPIFYENMTARKNLEIHCDYVGEKYKKEIDKILSLVGLEGEGEKVVKRYSLGMKQRLAIGRALLAEPELLLLDEPTNGLDPQGIAQFRTLIKDVNREKKTSIVVSSHILEEVAKIADTIGIISKGRMLSQISLEEVEGKYENLEAFYLDLINN